MAGFFGTVFGLLLLCIIVFCWWRILTTTPRAWRRRHEGGFWAAMNAVAKEDRERFLARQQAKAKARAETKPKGRALEFRIGVTSSADYDQEPEDVYDEARGYASREQAFEKWEASLVQLWNGNEDIEFTYESGSGRVRRKVTLQTVLRNDKFNVYLRGFCHLRGEERTFAAYSICTKVLIKGKRYEIEDFLSERLGIADKELGWS